ncbi:Fic family protein [Bacillus sp. S0628]|uniref:protein adenylyltransferase Fic n=1 Tax=Bacillus sp. S0628 TaxID=2957802 RepID=UPI00209F73A8|nr:Fic family protein [Bacillus sp. S0628]MCP1322057.1 Fic family protein [Bacillus sp. S0628]
MMLDNKLGITDQIELAKAEEKLSKASVKKLYDSGDIDTLEVGTYKGLLDIHKYLFDDIYDFSGKIRTVDISKGNFRFAPSMYLEASLKHIDQMQQVTLEEIVAKYIEMNIAHPFRDGNGRSMRIWLNLILKKEIKKVVDWTLIEKEEYLSAMRRSPVNDLDIRYLINNALTNEIYDRELFMKGIDISYYYEGYTEYKINDL